MVTHRSDICKAIKLPTSITVSLNTSDAYTHKHVILQVILPPSTSSSPTATDANILREHLEHEANTGMRGGVTDIMSGLPPVPPVPPANGQPGRVGYYIINVMDKVKTMRNDLLKIGLV